MQGFKSQVRKHDMADAMLSILWYIDGKRRVYVNKKRKEEVYERRKKLNLTCIEDLSQFRFGAKGDCEEENTIRG